jgi:tetratricopeptide (TPR) repeat protein
MTRLDPSQETVSHPSTEEFFQRINDRRLRPGPEQEYRDEFLTTRTSEQAITPFAPPVPTIVSTTLTGNDRESVADALHTVVDWVDWCLIVDIGIADDALEIVRTIAGDKLVVRRLAVHDDTATARNFGLAAAAEIGGDWALFLDTDERLDARGMDIRAALVDAAADVLVVNHVSGAYGRDRFFRLPARGRFVGPTHEGFVVEGGARGHLPGMVFDTLTTSQEDNRSRSERAVANFAAFTAEYPDDPRWFYYLGDALTELGRDDEAIAAFRVCASLNDGDEERAWAMYRAAESYCRLGRHDEAIEVCTIGMDKHAGLAELPWLAAFASWQAGRPAQAVYWARLSIAIGLFAGAGASVPSTGFRHPPALWEGPYDVLRFALRATGDDAGADDADRLFHQARAARETECGPSLFLDQTPDLPAIDEQDSSLPSGGGNDESVS